MGEKTKVLTNEGLEVYHEGIKKYIEETANIYINPDEESGTIDEDITTIPAKYVGYNNATSGLEATTSQGAIDEVLSVLDSHKKDESNPHKVTKEQIGLGNVNNTSDIDKPVSTATQNAIKTAIDALGGLKGHNFEVAANSNYILSNLTVAYNILIYSRALVVLQIANVANVYSVYNTGSSFLVAPIIVNQSANHGTLNVNSSNQLYVHNSNTSSAVRGLVLYI